MRAVIAMDSFKGSISSLEAGEAVKKGILSVYPEGEISVLPVADGGEGTVDALVQGMRWNRVRISVTGPMGKTVKAEYGISGDGKTAVMEMAAAAGLTLLAKEERNPLAATTYGVGEMIADAVQRGCRRFLIGIGGSATNDGGAGMLQALGFGLLDEEGKQISRGAQGLAELTHITKDKVLPQLEACTFRIACDVTNPLCGEQGCSKIYGAQKGADETMQKTMDAWLLNYAEIVQKCLGKDCRNVPGAGAAGGLGFGFLAFTHGVLEPGISVVLEEIGLESLLKEADIVITGEGQLDGQTAMGKAPAGVAALAKKYGKPVIAFSGAVTKDAEACHAQGIDAFFPALRRICTLETAMKKENAAANLEASAKEVFRLIRTIKEIKG